MINVETGESTLISKNPTAMDYFITKFLTKENAEKYFGCKFMFNNDLEEYLKEFQPKKIFINYGIDQTSNR